MKKMILIFIQFNFIFIVLGISNVSYATDGLSIVDTQKQSLNISHFIKESEKYTNEVFEDINISDILDSAISGKIDNRKIFKNIWFVFGKEVMESLVIIGSILVVIIIHSIIKAITEGLENKSTAQIAYYIQYILIITIVMKSFASILDIIQNSIQSLVDFINMLLPILITLMITTGNIVSATILQPIILFIITFIANGITKVIIPIILVSTALGVISQISDKIQIDKLAKFLKSSTIWVIGVVLTLFVGVTSLETSLTASVDGVTAKTTKAAVSGLVPVVGKILGDAVETVLGCSSILKNALGIVGVIVIIGICVTPIIKLTILMIIYYITAAICQPIADSKIIKLLEHMGDTFKILLGILCGVSTMLIISITIIIKISNSGVMYG